MLLVVDSFPVSLSDGGADSLVAAGCIEVVLKLLASPSDDIVIMALMVLAYTTAGNGMTIFYIHALLEQHVASSRGPPIADACTSAPFFLQIYFLCFMST